MLYERADDELVHLGRDSFTATTTRNEKLDFLPDARHGLTQLDRIILDELRRSQAEYDNEPVPTFILYTQVLERIDLSRSAFQAAFERLVGAGKVGLC